MKLNTQPLIRFFTSLKLTVTLLVLLMLLVFLCTFDQVNLGTFWAVERDIRSLFIYWISESGQWRFPIFPGGGLVGFLLAINLIFVLIFRFKWHPKKSGIWLIHIGIVGLILGEFITGFYQVETQMAIQEGETRNYSESFRDTELVIIDSSHPKYDEVISISQNLLNKKKIIIHERIPFEVHIKKYMRNAELLMIPEKSSIKSVANQGIGLQIQANPLPRQTVDDIPDNTTLFVELIKNNRSLGIWLLSKALGSEQQVTIEQKTYKLAVRPRRDYLPYTISLKDFSHDLYPGTSIPKNFSSQIHLQNPNTQEDRDVLIYMNHPMRYEGKTFYQSGFGNDNKLSIFQVVENPGWLMPYISFILVGIGLIIHFSLGLISFRKKQP